MLEIQVGLEKLLTIREINSSRTGAQQGEYKYKVGRCEVPICVMSSDQIETDLK